MAVDQEARDLINSLLAEFATRWDGGTWGAPVDFSVLVRQNQPPASGTSQFKGEAVPMAADTLLLREGGDIVGRKISALTDQPSPAAGDFVLSEDSAGGLQKIDVGNLPSGGAGETNTASNQGVGGVGVFNGKVGVDLQFRNIISDSGKITVALDAANKEVDLTVGSLAISSAELAANAVTNAKLADMANNTVKANVTGSTADPTDFDIPPSRMFGRKLTGNIVALTGAEALAIIGTIPLTSGGTGQTTQQAALDALMPGSPAEGDTLYYDGTNWVKHATRFSKLIAVADPDNADEFAYISFENDVTILEVKAYVVVGSGTPTANFNLINRAKPGDTGGTNITSSTIQATSAGTTTTSFSAADINAGNLLVFDQTAKSGTVDLIRIFVKYRYR